MFQRLLLASDGSRHAERAAQKAVHLVKELADAHLTILHVSAQMPAKHRLLETNFNVKELLEEQAREKLAGTLQVLGAEDVEYALHTAVGDPAEEIVKAARENSMDLIIIGSRGLNTIGEVLLGSVSHAVAHDAHCPVMVVK